MKRLLPILLMAVVSCGEGETVEPQPNGGKEPDKPEPPKIVTVDFEVLSSWEFKLTDEVPREVRELHGRKVEITGYIYPTRQTRNIRQFILMKDRGTCCYGPKTQWTHFLQVTIPKDKDPVNYSTDPVTVIGTFRLNPEKEDGYILGLYYLDAEGHKK